MYSRFWLENFWLDQRVFTANKKSNRLEKFLISPENSIKNKKAVFGSKFFDKARRIFESKIYFLFDNLTFLRFWVSKFLFRHLSLIFFLAKRWKIFLWFLYNSFYEIRDQVQGETVFAIYFTSVCAPCVKKSSFFKRAVVKITPY